VRVPDFALIFRWPRPLLSAFRIPSRRYSHGSPRFPALFPCVLPTPCLSRFTALLHFNHPLSRRSGCRCRTGAACSSQLPHTSVVLFSVLAERLFLVEEDTRAAVAERNMVPFDRGTVLHLLAA